MCWIPTNKEHRAIAKVAQKDIPIIKMGYTFQKNKFSSSVRVYTYDLQRPTPMVKIKPCSTHVYNKGLEYSVDYIAEGYHFYKPNMIKISLKNSIFFNIYSLLSKRCDACYITSMNKSGLCVAKGYIPKGTIYYLNVHGEGVAEQIVIAEFTNVKDYLTNQKLSKYEVSKTKRRLW